MTRYFDDCPACGGPKSLKAELCMLCRADTRRRTAETVLLPLAQAEREQHIIVEIVDDQADTRLVHLPADRSCVGGRGGQSFLEYDFAPATWFSVCGVRGAVYVRAGLLADTKICGDCEAAA